MKLITPATASEPYTAEAPSFRTSTRSIAENGITARFTPCTPWISPAKPFTRLPLISTSVWPPCRPRSDAVCAENVGRADGARERGVAQAVVRRDEVQQFHRGRGTRLLDLLPRDDRDGQGSFALHALDVGTRDFDLLDLLGRLLVRLGHRRGREHGRYGRREQGGAPEFLRFVVSHVIPKRSWLAELNERVTRASTNSRFAPPAALPGRNSAILTVESLQVSWRARLIRRPAQRPLFRPRAGA